MVLYSIENYNSASSPSSGPLVSQPMYGQFPPPQTAPNVVPAPGAEVPIPNDPNQTGDHHAVVDLHTNTPPQPDNQDPFADQNQHDPSIHNDPHNPGYQPHNEYDPGYQPQMTDPG